MRLVTVVTVASIMVAALFAGAADDDAKKKDAQARKELVGSWKGRVKDGATGHEITFTTDRITGVKDGTRDLGKGSFTLDLTTNPRRMDATEIKKEGEKARVWLGIYEQEGDALKWCVGSEKRPTEFATGDGTFMLVVKREKKGTASKKPSPAKLSADKPGKQTVAELKEPAPEALSDKVRDTLGESALRIEQDGKVLCDIWLRADVPVRPTSAEQADRKYPLESGTLVGAIRFTEKDAGDFRDLKIAPGVYTLRYALQPADETHALSKQFRDFFVLLSASHDTDPAQISDAKDLSKRGIDTTGETHPAILYLKPPAKGRAKLPTMVQSPGTDANSNLVVLVAKTTASGNEKIKEIQLELVTGGYAKE